MVEIILAQIEVIVCMNYLSLTNSFYALYIYIYIHIYICMYVYVYQGSLQELTMKLTIKQQI